MIEMIRLNDHLVRVTGFRRLPDPDRAIFDVVIQIPGDAAEQLFAPLLDVSRMTLEILQPAADPERHEVTLTDHQLHVAGPAHARLYRHQLRLEEASPGAAEALSPVAEELAGLLARFEALLTALDEAGIVERADIERRARELNMERR